MLAVRNASGTLSLIVASPSQSLYQLPVKRSPPDLTVMLMLVPPPKLSAPRPGAADLELFEAAEVEVAGVGAVPSVVSMPSSLVWFWSPKP